MFDFTRFFVLLRLLFRFLGGKPDRAVPNGSVLGHTINGAEVVLTRPNNTRAAHEFWTAASGGGKTMSGQSVRLQEYLHSYRNDPPDKRLALMIIDCAKGDFANGFLSGLAAEALELLGNVHWVHPFSVGAYAMNFNRLERGKTPIDITAQQLAYLVANLSTAVGAQAHLGAGARQLDAMVHLFLAVFSSQHPKANILWALDALQTRDGFKRLASLTTHPRARTYLEQTRLSPELAASVTSRIRTALASTDMLERIVAAEGSIQFAPMTGPGQILIFTVHEPPGGMMELSQFYANLFCRLSLAHLLGRTSPWQGHHQRIVIDEAQVVAGVLADVLEQIETTGRSKGLSVSLITQGTTLIRVASEALFKVLMTNTPTRIVGRLNASDAELFARESAPRKGADESFSQFRQRLAASITSLEDREFICFTPGVRTRYRSLDVDLESWDEAAATHKDAIDAVKTRYALPSVTERRVTLEDVTEAPKRRARRKEPVRSQKAKQATRTSKTAKAEGSVKPKQADKKPRSKWG